MLTKQSELPLWFWLGVPISVLAVAFSVKAWDADFYQTWILGELGFIESITLAVLILSIVVAIQILKRGLPFKPLNVWIGIILLGTIYFAGEEASWGQHITGWSAPENWQSINLQNEINLHNIKKFGGLFDQVPRNLLTLAAFVGGLLLPTYIFFKHISLNPDSLHYWLLPTYVCIPSASIAVFITFPDKIAKTFSYQLPDLFINLNAGEYKECFLAFFILFYLYSLLARLLNSKERKTGQDSG